VSTVRRERSVARNSGAAVATGRYLHFLDDDDWLLPGALSALKRLADTTGELWLYGASQLVDRQGNKLIELHHDIKGNCALQVMAGEWIPLQSSLFDAGLFFRLGGFDPLIPGAEDIDWTRRIALTAHVAGTHELVACIGMGVEGSSTDYGQSRQLIRLNREFVLDQGGAFTWLRAGATTAYWSGRLLRVYLTSVLWNLRQRNVTTALSRSVYAVTSLLTAGPRVFTPDFWPALTQPYRNDTFQRGFREAGLRMTA
jgi:glycosyltransferase involved in cell wall biosynthesis